MARVDRERWNERYRAASYDFTPSRWLSSIADRLRPTRRRARALDVACGGGRNTLLLATLGYAVDAWDISDVGLGILGAELERRAALGTPLAVRPRRVDLDRATLPVGRYDLILNMFFLVRPLLARVPPALRPGGLVVVETMVELNDGRQSHVRPEFKLRPGELVETFGGLEILETAEDPESGTARLLARRPATTHTKAEG